MRSSKSTFSFSWSTEGREKQHQRPGAPSRSSLDVLSRSTKRHTDGGAILSSVDIEITQGLLNSNPAGAAHELSALPPRKASRRREHSRSHSGLHRHSRLSSQSTQSSVSPQVHHGSGPRPASGAWTTFSNRDITPASTISGLRRSSATHAFDSLAGKHGLSAMSQHPPDMLDRAGANPSGGGGSDASLLSRTHMRSWLFRKFMRKPVSARPAKPSHRRHLSRKMSVGDANGLGGDFGYSVQHKNLDDISRLGGISIFVLPTEFSPFALAIPTCLAATGNYIAHNWRMTTGVFRVPGSFNTVNAILKHYIQQIDQADRTSNRIQETISSALLPMHVSCNIDDVASAFKKFLSWLPGGILGSWRLFCVLREINEHSSVDSAPDSCLDEAVRAKLVAFAIATLDCPIRISVICAVFGLLSLIGSDTEARRNSLLRRGSTQSQERMGYHALAVVFGPLLVGDLVDSVDLESREPPSDTAASGGNNSNNNNNNNRSIAHASRTESSAVRDDGILALHLAKTKLVVQITEMLISCWTEVVKELRNADLLGVEQRPDLPDAAGAAYDYSDKVSDGEDYPTRTRSADLLRSSMHVPKKSAASKGLRRTRSGSEQSRSDYSKAHSTELERGFSFKRHRYASDSMLRHGKRDPAQPATSQRSAFNRTHSPGHVAMSPAKVRFKGGSRQADAGRQKIPMQDFNELDTRFREQQIPGAVENASSSQSHIITDPIRVTGQVLGEQNGTPRNASPLKSGSPAKPTRIVDTTPRMSYIASMDIAQGDVGGMNITANGGYEQIISDALQSINSRASGDAERREDARATAEPALPPPPSQPPPAPPASAAPNARHQPQPSPSPNSKRARAAAHVSMKSLKSRASGSVFPARREHVLPRPPAAAAAATRINSPRSLAALQQSAQYVVPHRRSSWLTGFDHNKQQYNKSGGQQPLHGDDDVDAEPAESSLVAPDGGFHIREDVPPPRGFLSVSVDRVDQLLPPKASLSALRQQLEPHHHHYHYFQGRLRLAAPAAASAASAAPAAAAPPREAALPPHLHQYDDHHHHHHQHQQQFQPLHITDNPELHSINLYEPQYHDYDPNNHHNHHHHQDPNQPTLMTTTAAAAAAAAAAGAGAGAAAPSKGNATLYAEIQRLQRLLDARTDECKQAQRQLDAARHFRDGSLQTLSEQLRDTQRELKVWRTRAEWAERRLFLQDWEARRGSGGSAISAAAAAAAATATAAAAAAGITANSATTTAGTVATAVTTSG